MQKVVPSNKRITMNNKRRIATLEKEKDSLIEKLALIINGCQARGYNVDEIMLPSRNYPSSR